MKSRFQGNDQHVLCALADVILNAKPLDRKLLLVSSSYTLDKEIQTAEKAILQN